MSFLEILRRPEVNWGMLRELDENFIDIPSAVREEIEIQVKYEGYIERELKEVLRFKKREQDRIKEDFDYDRVPGLSNEVREKLKKGPDFVLADYFDFVAGTSTGAIIAACISLTFKL
jgi:tRNA uridine 5-carboxymethylaminomethyl modification enzyme